MAASRARIQKIKFSIAQISPWKNSIPDHKPKIPFETAKCRYFFDFGLGTIGGPWINRGTNEQLGLFVNMRGARSEGS